MTSSRISGFYALSVAARWRRLRAVCPSSKAERGGLGALGALSVAAADAMVENVLGVMGVPLGVGLNLVVNGRDVIVPMAVEEPSVIAAASGAALLGRAGGGFLAEADPGAMIGQIQLVDVPDPAAAAERLAAARTALLAAAAALTPGLCRRGGGPLDVEVRRIATPAGGTMLVVHVLIDTGDAMGANAVNAVVEGLAPLVERLAGGRVILRIVSNLADRRLARAAVRLPFSALARGALDGRTVAERIMQASRLASADPYRAATHNKGIMNGIDAVALATGNDWRAIEAGAHAFACRDGTYRALSAWETDAHGLEGRLELPLAVSTVGPLVEAHTGVRLALDILGTSRARDLAAVMAAVGLASNLGALRALAAEGIQVGHMALHARAVAAAAGARGAEAEDLRRRLVAGNEVKLDRARVLLAEIRDGQDGAPAVSR
jgi:hydroxymethylglutaryl-CoA reductase